jgi:hydrogenase maturation factor
MTSEIIFEGKVIRIQELEDQKQGWVELRGVRVRVDLSLLPAVQVGDHVLVQGRLALSRIETAS